MGLLFLILFAIAEVALIVLTFTKFSEKAKWLKNRVLVSAVELILLLAIILLPTTYMKWRFFCALGVMFIRLIIAALSLMIKRKKATGVKKKAGVIVKALLSLILVALSLVPTFLFANYNGLKTTGEFDIKESSAILIDYSREDEFENDLSKREVPIHFYYPNKEGEFPLVIFSHSAFGYYQSNYSTYAELASNGYVVVALDHPHHAFFTQDTNGNTIIVDSNFINDAMKLSNGVMSNEEAFDTSQKWIKLRTDDENFVLDTIKTAKNNAALGDSWHTDEKDNILLALSKTDTDKIGLIGHSMGGATAVALGRERDDIDAVIDLDGSMLEEIVDINNGKCEYNETPYPVPVLDFRKEGDYNKLEQIKNDETYTNSYSFGFAYVNNYTIDNALNGKTVVFKNAGHMNFTDLPLFSPFLASMLGTGDVDSEEFMYTVNGVVLNWFDYYLKNEGTLDIQAVY